MKEIDFKKIRTTAQASPNLIARIVIALGYQTIESGLGSQGFGNGIVFPIVIAGLTVSGALPALVAAGLTLTAAATLISLACGSFALFGILSLISAQYQMRKTRRGIIEAREKLNKSLAEMENELRELINCLHLLEQGIAKGEIPKDKLGNKEGGEDLKRNILEKIVTLLDQIPGSPNTTRVQKLQILFGTNTEEELKDKIINVKENEVATEEQNQLKEKLGLYFANLNGDIQIQDGAKELHQELFTAKLGDSKPDDDNKHIRRLGYATTLIGGFGLGFGTAITVAVLAGLATAAVMVTFPWILIPIGVGAIVAATALAINAGIKKRMERQKQQLDTANSEVLGVRKYVRSITKNTKTNVNQLTEAYAAQKEHDKLTKQNQTQQADLQKKDEEITSYRENAHQLELVRAELKIHENKLTEQDAELQKREKLVTQEKGELSQQRNTLQQQEQNLALRENQHEQRSKQLEEKAKSLDVQTEQNLKAQAELLAQKQQQDAESKRLDQLRLELEQQQKQLQNKLMELDTKNQQEPKKQDQVSAKVVADQMLHVFANEEDHTQVLNGKTAPQSNSTTTEKKETPEVNHREQYN